MNRGQNRGQNRGRGNFRGRGRGRGFPPRGRGRGHGFKGDDMKKDYGHREDYPPPRDDRSSHPRSYDGRDSSLDRDRRYSRDEKKSQYHSDRYERDRKYDKRHHEDEKVPHGYRDDKRAFEKNRYDYHDDKRPYDRRPYQTDPHRGASLDKAMPRDYRNSREREMDNRPKTDHTDQKPVRGPGEISPEHEGLRITVPNVLEAENPKQAVHEPPGPGKGGRYLPNITKFKYFITELKEIE